MESDKSKLDLGIAIYYILIFCPGTKYFESVSSPVNWDYNPVDLT